MRNMKKPVLMEADKPLSKAINSLMDSGTAVFVLKDGEYIGLIDDRHLSRGISRSASIKCENCVVRSPVLYEESTLEDGLKAFLTGKYKAVPVVNEKGKIKGMVTKVELIKEMMDSGFVPNKSVEDFMKSPVFTVSYSSSIGNARRKLKSKKVHKLLVTDGNSPRGIVSTFDLSAFLLKPKGRERKSVISEVKNPDNKPISEIIRERIVSVDIGTPLYEAMKVMVEKDVSNLLVTKKNSPAGVLSSTDVFKKVNGILKRKKWGIFISGLDREEDQQYYPMVRDRFESIAKRYSKSFNIQSISIHFKRKKSVYEAKVAIVIDGTAVHFSYSRHEILYLLDFLTREIKKRLNKRKNKRVESKRSGRAPKGKFSKKKEII